ncbi:HTH-type transcriptional activator RhaR, partial [termite gut metagenome]
MKDLETEEKISSKRPYNLKEKKIKSAVYRSLIRPELADELYDRILGIIVMQKKYKNP